MEQDSALGNVLAQYSEFHDARIETFALTSDGDIRATVSAHHASRDRYDVVDFVAVSVQYLELVQNVNRDPAFADYVFPAERTLESVAIQRSGSGLRVTLTGAYGWRLTFECLSLEMIPHDSNDHLAVR